MKLHSSHPTPTSSDRVACRCLKVTTCEVAQAIVSLGIRSVRELRDKTGAGNGCNCCHRLLQKFIDQQCVAEVEQTTVEPQLTPAIAL